LADTTSFTALSSSSTYLAASAELSGLKPPIGSSSHAPSIGCPLTPRRAVRAGLTAPTRPSESRITPLPSRSDHRGRRW
jgi:hypothetical protein